MNESEKSTDDSLKALSLSKSDYIKILNYYKIRIPTGSSSKTLKNKAENILSEKMCRCIKKIGTDNEQKAIGICTKTVINRKGYRRGKFSCSSTFSAKLNKSGATSRATRGAKKGRYITLSKLPRLVRNKTARKR
jgi:hypothetical protein